MNKLYCRAYQKVMKVASGVLDWSEPTLLKGPGSVLELPALIKSLGIQRVLLVTDKGLMGIGLPVPLIKKLEETGIACAVYQDTNANPTLNNIAEARKLFTEANCEAVIAFGGGSPMDCAKGVCIRVAYPNMKPKGLKITLMRKLPLLFAVPTTAGTGSEVTIAAVFTNAETHEKNALMTPKVRPKYAALDPALTVGLPPHITSTTGMDALTHAVEAYIGKSNTKLSAQKARDATRIIFYYLERAYKDGKDIEAREQMLQASYDAGMAFTRAYVGYVHAIAHNLGGMYGIPHGLANAIILPHVLDFYGAAAHARLADLYDLAGLTGAQSTSEKAEAFIQAIKDMNERMNIPNRLDCVKEEDIPLIAERALLEGNPLYPVPVIINQAQCEALIRSMMK